MVKKIQSSLDNAIVDNATIQPKSQIRNLEPLQFAKVSGKRKSEMVDTAMMFNRFITVALRKDDLEPVFDFELTYEPMFLFKAGMMQKVDK